jgi:small subunit ribosomal protein S15
MYLTSEQKKNFSQTPGKNEADTGSAEGQIAMFSFRIAHLTEHLKRNRKDFGNPTRAISHGRKTPPLARLLKERGHRTLRSIVKRT